MPYMQCYTYFRGPGAGPGTIHLPEQNRSSSQATDWSSHKVHRTQLLPMKLLSNPIEEAGKLTQIAQGLQWEEYL
ncbi:Nucleolar complex protein 2 [Venturia inaequalis]|nr:Nucleolar complex protein 2 [Venturia inaequalis]